MICANDSQRESTLSATLTCAAELLRDNPAAAGAQACMLLDAFPGQQQSLSLLVAAKSVDGDLLGLCQMLRATAAVYPNLASVQFELGLVLSELDAPSDAVAALTKAVALEPRHPGAWRALGDAFARLSMPAEARAAYAAHYDSAVQDLKLLEHAALGDAAMAETMLRQYLAIYPTDVSALYMLARFYMPHGRHDEAEAFYARALELAPSFTAARYNYALSLYHQTRAEQTIEQADILLQGDPGNHNYRALKATALGLVGEYDQAIALREALLQDDPARAVGWVKYGHLLRIKGRTDDAIAAYREAIKLLPGLGEAYWSLTNLKTFRFGADDIAAMRAQLENSALGAEDRCHFCFALGAAFEGLKDYAQSFQYYRQGNALRREELSYDADRTTAEMRAAKQMFTRQFLRARRGMGDLSPAPIFIVGLPRSGSTLIEQILSSHSAIEGTSELPDIGALVRRVDRGRRDGGASGYPEILKELDEHQLKALGAEYLERTHIHRKSRRLLFIDKAPSNFRHIGFIQLILPNAKIIDARRDPMGCGFSNFKQYFASGVGFSFDLADIGRYYRDYVELMDHFDAVLPGRIHRVFYERMINDPEDEIRRLLDYCGVPFEASCLQFHATQRNVMTPSSQQVRKPIYNDSLEQWRPFDAWLGPLKSALGPVLDAYPDVPRF